MPSCNAVIKTRQLTIPRVLTQTSITQSPIQLIIPEIKTRQENLEGGFDTFRSFNSAIRQVALGQAIMESL